MTVQTTIDVVGLKELEAALKDLGSEVAGKNGGLVRTALMGAALPVMRTAQSLAPVDSHKLEKSIKRSRQKDPDPDLNANEAVDVGLISKRGTGIAYGGFVEFGTVKMAARPFLRPALESNVRESTMLFRKRLAAGIERVAKKIGNKNAAAVGARIKKL